MNRQKAFTLIELLVVIAVIALLLAVLLPALRSAKEQAKRIVCLSHTRSLITGVHVYASSNDDNIPASIDGMNASWNFVCWQTYDSPPRWINLGRLYGTRVIEDPGIFFCPSQKNKILQDDYMGKTGIGWNWSSPTGNEERAISYNYGLLAEIRSMPELELKSLKLSDLKNRALISDVFLQFGQGEVWAHKKGISAGFGDGHAEFKKIDQEVIDAAATLGVSSSVNTAERDRMDLFVAAMFDLLAGRRWVMEREFLP